jgi:hypothetical protein
MSKFLFQISIFDKLTFTKFKRSEKTHGNEEWVFLDQVATSLHLVKMLAMTSKSECNEYTMYCLM